MNAIEFSQAIKQPDVYLLDVRPLDFYNQGHIEGAHNLDVTQPDFSEKAVKTLPKDKTIAVYCNTGRHSALAEQQLQKLGYNVINLDEGINSWIANNLPIVK